MEYSEEYVQELERDIKDLLELSSVEKCHKCNRYKLIGYCCNHCGHDNSEDD